MNMTSHRHDSMDTADPAHGHPVTSNCSQEGRSPERNRGVLGHHGKQEVDACVGVLEQAVTVVMGVATQQVELIRLQPQHAQLQADCAHDGRVSALASTACMLCSCSVQLLQSYGCQAAWGMGEKGWLGHLA